MLIITNLLNLECGLKHLGHAEPVEVHVASKIVLDMLEQII